MIGRNRITVAAVVPVYNAEKYLPQCIESLVLQTEPFDEVLLIDDGSSDNSLDICMNYQCQYANIHVYSHKNKGVSYTRNRGIAECSSNFILFVDSDDMLNACTVNTVKQCLNDVECDMILYDADIVCEEGFERKDNPYDRRKWISEGAMQGCEFLQKMFPECYTTTICTMAYRRDFLKRNRILFPVGINYAEDTLFMLQSLLSSDLVYYTAKMLYHRRCRANSVTTSAADQKKVSDSFFVAGKVADIMLAYMQHSQNYFDNYIAIVLFHFMVAIQRKHSFEEQVKSVCKENELYNVHNLAMILFHAYSVWGAGDNLSNIQTAFRLIENWENLQQKKAVGQVKWLLQKTYEKHLFNKLKLLPFDKEDVTVIIYGTGTAAKAIISLYREKIGKIYSRIAFVRTKASQDEVYMGQPVYNVKNIPDDTQYIVISSYRFRNEMKEALRTSGVQGCVIDLYENEYFDIVW